MSRDTRSGRFFEQLEARQMLAGDVTVSLAAGNLFIRGDDLANQVVVTSGEEAGSLVIRGLEGTTIHMAGQSAAPETGLVVKNVKGQVNVSMGAGDDLVAVSHATFPRGLSIETGAGADRVQIGVPLPTAAAATAAAKATVAGPLIAATSPTADVTVKGSLLIFTGGESDQVTIDNTSVAGFLSVATAGGDDIVQLGVATPPAANAAKTLSLADDDPTLTVRAGLGVDVLLGDGADKATLRGVKGSAAITVGGGLGEDMITADNLRSFFLFLRGGDGDSADAIAVNKAKATAAEIDAGGGADHVNIVDSAFKLLTATLGKGDDVLAIHGTKADRAVLVGGDGSADQLDAADNTIGKQVVTGFEIPEGVNTPRPTPRPLLQSITQAVTSLLGKLRN